MTTTESLLDKTLAAAVADRQTATAEGKSTQSLIEGQSTRDSVLHIDERGALAEMFDTRWNWHSDPIEFVYYFTIRPGCAKGWGLHQRHEDRYFLMCGEVELVLYDVRPESSTCGQISRIFLSQAQPKLINIPAFVWHADVNIGSEDAILVNFPTIAYDHAAPDKMRLPLDTDLIPHDFGDAKGW